MLSLARWELRGHPRDSKINKISATRRTSLTCSCFLRCLQNLPPLRHGVCDCCSDWMCFQIMHAWGRKIIELQCRQLQPQEEQHWLDQHWDGFNNMTINYLIPNWKIWMKNSVDGSWISSCYILLEIKHHLAWLEMCGNPRKLLFWSNFSHTRRLALTWPAGSVAASL